MVNFFKRKTTWFCVAALIMIFAGWIYVNAYKASSDIETQMSQLVNDKDKARIERIAGDKTTCNFIENLPKRAKLKNLSDVQGITPDGAEYYVGEINKKSVDVYARKEDKGMGRLMPKWVVIKVKVAP